MNALRLFPCKKFCGICLGILVFSLAGVAEPVNLRGVNGNIVRVEIVSVERDRITVRRPESESHINLEWEKLDLAWLKENQPEIWKKREELRRPTANSSQREKPKDDLFSKESLPEDPADLARRILASLNDPILCANPWELPDRPGPKPVTIPPDTLRNSLEDLLNAGVTPGVLVRLLFITQCLENKGTVQRDLENLASSYQREAKKRFGGYPSLQDFTRAITDKKPSLRPGLFLKIINEQDGTARAAYLFFVNQPRLRNQALAVLRKYESLALDMPDPTREVAALRHRIARTIVVLEKIGKNTSNTVDRNFQADCADLMNKLAVLAK